MATTRKKAAKHAPNKAALKTQASTKKASTKKASTKKASTKKASTKKASTRKDAPTKAAKHTPNKAAKHAPNKAALQSRASAKKASTRQAAPPKAAPSKKASPRQAAPPKAAPPKAAPAPKPTAPARPAPRVPPVLVRPAGGGRVVEILDAEQPIEALRRYLAKIVGTASVQEGQVALGSAQLMLLPIAREHRGGAEVKALLDLVLSRWVAFPDPAGFHAQEFLRNAFAAVGEDRERIAQLLELVPAEPSSELLLAIACAHAIAGDRPAMVAALRGAIAAGVTAAQVRRDGDLARFLDDPELLELLDGARAPAIPVDLDPHLEPVREALDALVSTLEDLGQRGTLNPPATLDLVLSAERAKKIQLPNDYRALLTIADGFSIWDNAFLGTIDYRTDTPLAKSAREYLEMSAGYGATGIDECVPIANWGQPNDWLLFDPHGTIRGGEPGYVLMLNADELPIDDLVAALDRIARIAADVLGTN